MFGCTSTAPSWDNIQYFPAYTDRSKAGDGASQARYTASQRKGVHQTTTDRALSERHTGVNTMSVPPVEADPPSVWASYAVLDTPVVPSPPRVGGAVTAVRGLRPAGVPALRVLLVEDVAVSRDLLCEMLGRYGHEVVCAADGVEAVALAARERFDVVVMDLRMPRMDGIEATRRIRELDAPGRGVPIVGLTADVREEERRRCLVAGMDRCLAKPLAWPELLAILEEAAAQPARQRPRAAEAGAWQATPSNTDDGAAPLHTWSSADAGSTGLLRRFVEDAERSCELLRASPAAPAELLEQAHRLKGTAGLLGLERIAAAAGAVEAAARTGLDPAGPLDRLASAVRESLRDGGLLDQ